MANSRGLSEPRVILLATHLSAESQLEALGRLQALHPTTLHVELVLRILLTFLPESTEPSTYVPLLDALVSIPVEPSEDEHLDISSVRDLTEAIARQQVRKLHLIPLEYQNASEITSEDPLTQFIIHRAHQIEAETGLLPLLLPLVEPFVDRSDDLRNWLISTLLPLLRFNYEYYPGDDTKLSLDAFQALNGRAAIQTLLSRAERDGKNGQIGRDLRGLVGPWTYGHNSSKRRKLGTDREATNDIDEAHWQDVNEWIVSTSSKDYRTAVKAIIEWDGPRDLDLGGFEDGGSVPRNKEVDLTTVYGQAALATIYATEDSSLEALEGSKRVAERVGDLLGFETPRLENAAELSDVPTDAVARLTRASLLQNAVLNPANALTLPSQGSYNFLLEILSSIGKLRHLGRTMCCRAAVEICLFADEAMQKEELRRLVHNLVKVRGANADWAAIRTELNMQRSWHGDSGDHEPGRGQGIFWRVDRSFLETELLKALLNAGYYQWAIRIYADGTSQPLAPDCVEKVVEDCIMSNYDNASNGNRSRGGMKKASDILAAFRSHIAPSSSLYQIEPLLAATHALSFYQLRLQHGVPFQPVSIRVHHDPIELIEKVLHQNPRSYTKLDDLTSIGRNLVAAGLSKDDDSSHGMAKSLEAQKLDAERRVTYLALSAALNEDDFGTAYSYIMTRLSPSSVTDATADLNASEDDISWRAAYHAGRHKSPPSNSNIAAQISLLSQRMELLSLALVLTPTPEPLPEILGVWRRCDEELDALRSQEHGEESAWDERGDSIVPGGFGPGDMDMDKLETERARRAKQSRGRRGTTGQEEAPMGLFDVARGAARAIGKSAFPLHGQGGTQAARLPTMGREGTAISDDHESRTSGEEQRVRKRDMVSNMVTGGLASGIGWVLGAPPANDND